MILLDKQLSKNTAQHATKDEAIEIISKLEWELHRSTIPGIGLAAPQIGIDKAVAIVRVKNPYDPTEPVINVNLVNPNLIDGHDLIGYNEGCLSFPGKSVRTVRYNDITIETMDDYEYYSEQINAKRYDTHPRDVPLLTNGRRLIQFNELSKHPEIREIEQLICICVQHEFSHLLGLTMYDFKPQEIGRNDLCPCGSDKKNKKCHNYTHYNDNLKKLFNSKYAGA